MKILMTLANPFTNDSRAYNEAKSLVDGGHEVTVLACDNTGKHQKNEVKDSIIILISYNYKFMGILPYDFFRLRKTENGIDIDVNVDCIKNVLNLLK